jgi:tripartite-type tricarboxylate transporter receptor subunit TctC
MRKRRAILGGMLAAPAIAATPRRAAAQGPVPGAGGGRPLRLVGGFPPGGSVDNLARILAPRLQVLLGQTVVVENRPGANGTVALAEVARGPADGGTWMLATDSHAIVPGVMPLPYDARRDLAPVILIGQGPLVVTTHPATPWASFAALVEDARRRPPGEITYATAGVGSMMHVSMALLTGMAGVRLTHVPYRGGAPALADALAGHVPLFVTNAPVGGPPLRSGALRGLGVTTRAPSRHLPGIPSFHEMGFAGFEAPTWWALLCAAGVPEPARRRMEEAMATVLAEPETRARVEAQGMDVLALSGADAARFVDAEFDRWGRVVRENGIRAES